MTEKRQTIEIPTELHDRLKKFCDKKQMKVKVAVSSMIEQYLRYKPEIETCKKGKFAYISISISEFNRLKTDGKEHTTDSNVALLLRSILNHYLKEET